MMYYKIKNNMLKIKKIKIKKQNDKVIILIL